MIVWTWQSIAIGLMWALATGAFAWYVGQSLLQINYITLADGRRQERSLPVFYRMLLPFTPNLARFVNRPGFARLRADLDRRLVSAGYEGVIDGAEMLALRFLMPVILGPILVLAAHYFVSRVPGRIGLGMQQREALFHVLLVLWLFLQPGLWLSSAVRLRHKSIERALPFVLDLLTLSVEAGLDFMTAMKRIIERRVIDPLGEELVRVFREVQLGKTRREALRDMAERVNQNDVRSVVNALVQADELGVSIGAILRIQADQMRIRRFLNAEKIANEAPVKMLFPLIGFIFPAVFIVLLGPILVQIIAHGF